MLNLNRREFVLAAGAAAALPRFGIATPHRPANPIRVGVIGCGGRGTGAAVNALEASPDAEIYALADAFPERISNCINELTNLDDATALRSVIPVDRQFSGFDAYKQLLATDVDVVILTTPPHFRPAHFEAAIEAGKHVFLEKPCAVDPAGIRRVLVAAEKARAKGLSVVAGTQRRHEASYLAAMQKIKEGAIGRITGLHCSWNQGGLWVNERRPEWSDMEWQLRNWLYFTWLSGDHIVEQHVHNLDVCNWAMGAHPVRCVGQGGRQSRTEPKYGHIFDHFAVEYEYPNGVLMTSTCRQIDGCASAVREIVVGSEGRAQLSSGSAAIRPHAGQGWTFPSGSNNNPYVQEHIDLIDSIKNKKGVNEAVQVAESTLTAIMGRMSAYTGKEVTWEQAMNSQLDLTPPSYQFGPLPIPEVAIPGKTPLV